MLTIILAIAVIWIALKMLVIGIRVAWGIAKILAIVILFPLFIITLSVVGLFYIALPILIVAMIVMMIGRRVSV